MIKASFLAIVIAPVSLFTECCFQLQEMFEQSKSLLLRFLPPTKILLRTKLSHHLPSLGGIHTTPPFNAIWKSLDLSVMSNLIILISNESQQQTIFSFCFEVFMKYPIFLRFQLFRHSAKREISSRFLMKIKFIIM